MEVVATTSSVLPSIHMSVGAALASAAMNISIFFGFSVFTWFTWWGDESSGENAEETVDSSIPAYLRNVEYRKNLNIGLVGPAGSGKSSLINALRGLTPDDLRAAPVGLEATTREALSYLLRLELDTAGDSSAPNSRWGESAPEGSDSVDGPKEVRVWDLPALPTTPKEEAFMDTLGLPFFDLVLIVYSQRISGLELALVHSLEEIYKVPHMAVRTQVDLDIESEAADYGRGKEEVLTKLHQEAASEGLGSVHLVSAREPRGYELPQLISSIWHVAKARHRAHLETECPICYEAFGMDEDHVCCSCHWCGNAVCNRCACELRGSQAEVACPFCRRWTSLARPPII